VEYSPVGNCRYTYSKSKRTEGIIVGIEIHRFGGSATFAIEQIKDMEDSSCNMEKNYYVVGQITKMLYGDDCRSMDSLKLLKRRARMNEIIIEMFPVTKEAVLVDKHFGREIDKPIFKMLIKGKEKELLEESIRLEGLLTKKF